jgi:hypothetical protein
MSYELRRLLIEFNVSEGHDGSQRDGSNLQSPLLTNKTLIDCFSHADPNRLPWPNTEGYQNLRKSVQVQMAGIIRQSRVS